MPAGAPSISTKHGHPLQIWVAEPSKSNLTSGTITNVIAIWCHSAGTIDVTFSGESSAETWAQLYDGDQVGLMPKASVSITSGTWSFMVA